MVVMPIFLYGNGKINKFLDMGDNYGLSKLAYNFLGGIMKMLNLYQLSLIPQ